MPQSSFNFADLIESPAERPIDLIDRYINPSFAKVLRTIGYDIDYVRGQGAYLWDRAGHRYIDCLGGYAVFNVGRNHPVVRDVIKQAMDADLPNLIKMGSARLSGLLAKELVAVAPGELDTVFFTNSGSEGVETAIKYARAATGRERMVYCKGGFHGLTMGSLSLNGGAEFRDGFGTLLANMHQVPFNDIGALERALSANDVAGFIVEPIQGKGVHIAGNAYLREAADLCRKHGTLFILDEVQTGYGRTGKMFACEHWGFGSEVGGPDILVTAKGLSGGYVPVGAVLSKRWIHKKVFSSMDKCVVHSTTYGQNDLAMAAGLATLHVLREEKLIENAAAVGGHLMQRLRDLIPKYEMLTDVRGKGLMIGIEFGPPKSLTLQAGWKTLHSVSQDLFTQAMLIPLLTDHRVLAQVAGHHMDIIKLIPPLVLTKEDADAVADAFDAVIGSCHKFPGPVWAVGKKLVAAAVSGR